MRIPLVDHNGRPTTPEGWNESFIEAPEPPQQMIEIVVPYGRDVISAALEPGATPPVSLRIRRRTFRLIRQVSHTGPSTFAYREEPPAPPEPPPRPPLTRDLLISELRRCVEFAGHERGEELVREAEVRMLERGVLDGAMVHVARDGHSLAGLAVVRERMETLGITLRGVSFGITPAAFRELKQFQFATYRHVSEPD